MTKVETNKAREKREELEELKEDEREAAKERKAGKDAVEPFLASDVAPGFTAGPVPAAKDISKIVLDTTTYGTETPPRQTPPTSIENFMKHSPPSFHDSNGAKIASLAPTLGSISPNTAVAVTGADLTVTGTGTNIDRATFLTANGAVLTNTQYLTATTCSAVIRPALNVPGVVLVRVQNPAGTSASQNFTFT
jgi:IPT/TIG domain